MWRGENSAEWKSWQQKMEQFKRTTDAGGSWTPRGRKEEARAAFTALRTLALEESNIAVQKR
jgi:hypothetical protein